RGGLWLLLQGRYRIRDGTVARERLQVVPRRAGEPLTIGGEGHAGHPVRVPPEMEHLGPAVRIPHTHRLVPRRAGEPLTIAGEANAVHLACVPLEDQHLSRSQVQRRRAQGTQPREPRLSTLFVPTPLLEQRR